MDVETLEILRHFPLGGEILSCELFGCGHIHDTYEVKIQKPDLSIEKYVLQQMNETVFKDIDALMENILKVTSIMSEKISKSGGDPCRETLEVIPDCEGHSYIRDNGGRSWRVFRFIERSFTKEKASLPEDFYQAGKSFGRFQFLLSDVDIQEFKTTIPDFHNTPKRFQRFMDAVEQDTAGRAESIRDIISDIYRYKEEVGYLMNMIDNSILPIRITHNDTKLNNVLFDVESGRGLCVIDLDTVMPGICHMDYGDAIRFGASTAPEDETDLDRVHFDLEMYRAFTLGFLEETIGILTDQEIQTLVWGPKIITLETGIRFLTDYLEGDVYFKTHYPDHNLDRARNQLHLVHEMEKVFPEMMQIVLDCACKAKISI